MNLKCEKILSLLESGKMVRVNDCDMVLTPNKDYITWFHFGSSANRKSAEEVYRILVLFANDGNMSAPVYINEDRSHYLPNPKLTLVEV